MSTLLLVVIATSCSFAQKQTFTNKTYPIDFFDSVESDVVGNIIYTQSDRVSVRAEGDKELVDRLRITEHNGVLSIGHTGNFKSQKKQNLSIYISSPTIYAVDTEGVGNWFMKGRVDADNLEIDFDGVGNFEALDLYSNNIKVDYEGVGNLTLGGTTSFVEIFSDGKRLSPDSIYATDLNINLFNNPLIFNTREEFRAAGGIKLPLQEGWSGDGSDLSVKVTRIDLHRWIDLSNAESKGLSASMKETLKSWGYIQ